MRTLQRAAFIAHLTKRHRSYQDAGLQLIVNNRSCQWMTDGDEGATWFDELYETPQQALQEMREMMDRIQGNDPARYDHAYSARVIF